jgi:ATP-dependent helicase HrpB
VRACREVRAGALVLSAVEGPASPGDQTTAVLIEQMRSTGGALLSWTPAARGLQQRLGFLHDQDPEAWPDVSDRALLADLEEWLVAFAPNMASRRDLEKVDMVAALRSRLGSNARHLAELAPTSFEAAGGRAIAIDYSTGEPRASVRVQDLYGTTVHPMVYRGRVPVVLELLSPARRPIQVTADLVGFWAGSWSEVRKEMAGRYPKHPWPVDPAGSSPPPPRRAR